jgi:hypothetical protein
LEVTEIFWEDVTTKLGFKVGINHSKGREIHQPTESVAKAKETEKSTVHEKL